ncbi:MAG: hypothetical protein RIB93_11930 [Coleofasciculus sp. D1-CHI-01]|uniref:hypothetical protein n=1 Tax=Coleofasciculus sp. D1-CHI-01 TaxID=3068482 RepID=UPI00330295AC
MITHTLNNTAKPALSPPPDDEIYPNPSRDRTPILPIIYPNPVGAGLGIKSSDNTPNKTTKPALSPPPDHEIYPKISGDRTPILPIL